MAAKYMTDEDGNFANCECDRGLAMYEFFGFCAKCWAEFKPEQRAMLRGEPEVVKQVVHHTYMPARHWLPATVLLLWRVAVAGLLAWVAFR